METIIIILIVLVVLVFYYYWKQQKEEEQLRIREILELADKAQRAIERIDNVKGMSSKANNCGKALKYLYAASQFKEYKEVITNYEHLTSRLRALEKVFPVIGHLEKAAKYKYKGNDKSEKNALLDAMYEIDTVKITDKDIIKPDIQPDGSDNIVLIEDIEARLKELGWEPSGT